MENTESGLLKPDTIKNRILTIRGVQVMIDWDLAELYGVETKRINEQVKRNPNRFPVRYCFQLTEKEKDEVVAICDHLSNLKFSYQLPYAFTEQGVAYSPNAKKGVSVTICTKTVSKALEPDLDKHNVQYDPIAIRQFGASHDRFLILGGLGWLAKA